MELLLHYYLLLYNVLLHCSYYTTMYYYTDRPTTKEVKKDEWSNFLIRQVVKLEVKKVNRPIIWNGFSTVLLQLLVLHHHHHYYYTLH
jgi:hypothetical protein